MDLLIIAALFAIFWAVLILPQRKRLKRHNEMVASIEVGDELLLTSGIYGTVTDSFDDDFFVEVSPGVEIRIASGAVASRIEFEDDEGTTETVDEIPDEGDAGSEDD